MSFFGDLDISSKNLPYQGWASLSNRRIENKLLILFSSACAKYQGVEYFTGCEESTMRAVRTNHKLLCNLTMPRNLGNCQETQLFVACRKINHNLTASQTHHPLSMYLRLPNCFDQQLANRFLETKTKSICKE